VLHVDRVARDDELRVRSVALGGLSLARPAARHAKALAEFDAQVGKSVKQSGLSPVPQDPNPPNLLKCGRSG